MISSSLEGRYFVGIQNGTLFVDFDADSPELWLRSVRGEFKLLPCADEEFQQLSLPFEYEFNLTQMAFSYKPIFKNTLRVIDQFSSEKQSIITFCLRYGEAALELIDDTPGLAFLIASRNFYQYGVVEDETCISPANKRGNLLQQFGYPKSGSVAKIFRKIPAAECSHEFFHDLKFLFDSNNSKVIKAMRHVKRLNHLTVKMLTINELLPYLRISLLEEMSNLKPQDIGSQPYFELTDIQSTISDAIDHGIKLPILRKVSDLSSLHDDLIHWLYTSESLEQLKKVTLPAPPFSGLVGNNGEGVLITPLETGVDLWQEGRVMHHCIAGYSEAIAQADGSRYAYRVLLEDNERATLLICKESGHWRIEEIRGYCNEDVSKKMMSAVVCWLEDQQRRQWLEKHSKRSWI